MPALRGPRHLTLKVTNPLTKWAKIAATLKTGKGLRRVTQETVAQLARRLEAVDGKAMPLCPGRRIGVGLYNEISKPNPGWHHDDDDWLVTKIAMTGSAPVPRVAAAHSEQEEAGVPRQSLSRFR